MRGEEEARGKKGEREGGMGGVDRERETERASAERMQVGGGGGPRGGEGDIPGARRRRGKAGESSSLRPGLLAVLLRGSERETGRETRSGMEREENRIVVVTTGWRADRGERDR